VHYDPILSKVIAWGRDREEARRRVLSALREMAILGIQTTVGFLQDIVSQPEFIVGNTHTDFLEKHMLPWKQELGQDLLEAILLGAAVDAQGKSQPPKVGFPSRERKISPWQMGGGWRIGGL
jgi:acetyl/propionyl-CoA carboxylase alpha subunit